MECAKKAINMNFSLLNVLSILSYHDMLSIHPDITLCRLACFRCACMLFAIDGCYSCFVRFLPNPGIMSEAEDRKREWAVESVASAFIRI